MAYFPVLLLGYSKVFFFWWGGCFLGLFLGVLSLFSGKGFPYHAQFWFWFLLFLLVLLLFSFALFF